MQLVQPVSDVRVVLEHAVVLGFPSAPRPEQTSLGRREPTEDELRELLRPPQQIWSIEPATRFGERGQCEPVPRGDRLVVAQWFRPLLPLGEQARTRAGVELAPEDRAAVLERMQQLAGSAVLLGPGIRQTFDAVRVRVLRRGKAALRQTELAQHVFEGLPRNVAVTLIAGYQPAVQICRNEQRVVVEHLLEVRDQPFAVDRVTVEAAAEQVV